MIDKKNDPRRAMKFPDDFLEKFEDRLMDNIDLKNTTLTIKSRRNYYGIAAVFIVLLGALIVFKFNINDNTSLLADITLDDNWEYLLENSEDLTFEELVSFEESDEAMISLEEEIYGDLDMEILIDDIDLQTLETLYE